MQYESLSTKCTNKIFNKGGPLGPDSPLRRDINATLKAGVNNLAEHLPYWSRVTAVYKTTDPVKQKIEELVEAFRHRLELEFLYNQSLSSQTSDLAEELPGFET